MRLEREKYVSTGYRVFGYGIQLSKITPDMLKYANTTPENLAKQVIQNKEYWAEHGQETQEMWDKFMTE